MWGKKEQIKWSRRRRKDPSDKSNQRPRMVYTHNTVQFPSILRPTDVTILPNLHPADLSWHIPSQPKYLLASKRSGGKFSDSWRSPHPHHRYRCSCGDISNGCLGTICNIIQPLFLSAGRSPLILFSHSSGSWRVTAHYCPAIFQSASGHRTCTTATGAPAEIF